GAIGLEALSRGAREVRFIEQDPAAVRIIQENLAAFGISDEQTASVVRAPVRKGLRMLAERGVRADLCFLDPPYAAQYEYARSLRWLMGSELMAPGGLIILEHSRKEAADYREGQWSRKRLLTQGSSALSFYRKDSAVVSAIAAG